MLEALFNPSSVAVIGASKDPRKVGYAVLDNLVRYRYPGKIYPVNPNAGDILGVKAVPKVTEADGSVDMAVISVPAPLVPDALLDCAAAGVRAAIVISAGFKEAGPEGVRREERIKAITRKHSLRMLGPNCLGLINTANNMNASFAGGMLPKGRISFFSQSGALGIAILDWALGNNIGFSKFISLGNKTDLNEIDFIEYFMNDPETDVILGYIEDVVDGRRFFEVARRATKVKPIILIKSGGTEAGARAASSHTGALAGSEVAFNAAFKQTGIIKADGIEDLFDTALAFSGRKLPAGDRLLIVTNAGGPGIIAADTAEKMKVRLPQMTRSSIEAIASLLPPTASLYNPVDIIGDATSERYAVVLSKAVHDPHVDGIVVILTPQAMTDVENTAEVIIETARATDKPVLASFIGEKRVRGSLEKLKTHSIPAFVYPETAVRSFRRMYDYAAWQHRFDEPPPKRTAGREKVAGLISSLLTEERYEVGEESARDILSRYGFAFPERALARTSMEAFAIAERIGPPLVMKISSPDILHKTDVGGVKLNVGSALAARDAFTEITSNVRRLMPDAFIEGVMLYEMIRGGREVIIGVTYDRTFGHLIMFGLGGIYVEVLKDVSFRIAPVSQHEALAMINEIRTSALLRGARGEKPVDIEAIAEGIARVSDLVTEFPRIRELDINPLTVMNRGAFALDARIIFERPE
ncbi:MAG: acetate--CoA ligase family protein [Thermodesulfovibrionales bacterium]